MSFKNGKSYVVTESFITSVLNDHEVGGSWETGRVVPLDPGNHFTVESGPNEAGWSVAQMDEPLYFESKERPGDSLVVWKGKFYVRNDAHFKKTDPAQEVPK